LFFTLCLAAECQQKAQSGKAFTHADTLRGSITPERAWWNVLRYDIEVMPFFETKSIKAKTIITYKVLDAGDKKMQVDLQQPLLIDSIEYNGGKLSFKK